MDLLQYSVVIPYAFSCAFAKLGVIGMDQRCQASPSDSRLVRLPCPLFARGNSVRNLELLKAVPVWYKGKTVAAGRVAMLSSSKTAFLNRANLTRPIFPLLNLPDDNGPPLVSRTQVTTLFVTGDFGILMQDSFPLEEPLEALLGLQVYLVEQ